MEEVDDDGSDDDEAPVNVFRSDMLERLAIDKVVNLAEHKLIMRFSPLRPVPTRKSPSTQPVPKPVSEGWSAANSQWATKPFSFDLQALAKASI